MGYYSELLDSMIEAGAFNFGSYEDFKNSSEYKAMLVKDYFECSERAHRMDKEKEHELEGNH